MTYIPTEWQTGDIVTAEKLNKLESGVLSASGGGILTVILTQDDEGVSTLNKTWKEIHDAMASEQIAVIVYDTPTDLQQDIFREAEISEGQPKPYTVTTTNGNIFFAETENDYPDTDDGSTDD